ncbi:MAG TPA: ribosome biogenesis factor YjgA [Kofleriaceae bacterium]|jgi:ribosome-associated protein
MSVQRGDKGNRQDGNRLTGADRTNREVVRGKRRRAGDVSAKIARDLMQIKDAHVKKLRIDDELRDAINEARKITAPIARRRAERTLAGELRRWDLQKLTAEMAKLAEATNVDSRKLHDAENWRTKLIDGGIEAANDLPGGPDDELARMIMSARREKETTKPPGAQRALFREIMKRLDAKQHDEQVAAMDADPEHTDPDDLDEDDDSDDDSDDDE